MQIRDGFTETIGHTPLIRLRRASEMTGCTILGKAEFLNPGGSVKDRAALYIIKDAEERGALHPGGVIVEGTAGNTGIGLALVGNARGYRSVIVMPETQSQEKKDMLRLCGADLRLVPAVPYANPMNYVRYSERLAQEMLPILFDLVLEEGLILGGSTGINIAGALRAAKELGPGHVIVTVLADYGTRYQSKLFNPAFLRERKLPIPEWLDQ